MKYLKKEEIKEIARKYRGEIIGNNFRYEAAIMFNSETPIPELDALIAEPPYTVQKVCNVSAQDSCPGYGFTFVERSDRSVFCGRPTGERGFRYKVIPPDVWKPWWEWLAE